MNAGELVERALERCRADGCVVLLEEESAVNLRWANGALTTNGSAEGRRLTVVAVADRPDGVGVGVVSAAGAVDSLDDLVGAAEAAAREATPAPDAQPLVPAGRDASSWAAPVPRASVAALAPVVTGLREAFAAARDRRRLLYGYAEHRRRTTFLGSSTGLRLRHDQPSGHIELTARTAAGDASGWAGAATRDFSGEAVRGLYDGLERQLAWAGRRVELPPGRYDCVLPPAAVADLMSYVYWAANARDAAAGHSVYSRAGGGTRVGEALAELPLTLRGDPGAAGVECPPFVLAHASDATVSVFDNGLPLAPTAWIDRGRLAALPQTRRTAGETAMPVTPHIDNLILESPGGAGSVADLVAGTDRGLLVTSLWYIREVEQRTLLLTGLTRDGVYLVEGGEVVGAVNNFRFNESPVDLLRRVRRVGATEPTRPREWGDAFTAMAMPPLAVADFTMSSVSPST